jgi:KUP system potassium uptake protein
MLSTFAMAFQTLGVVYGDMGTSPLYVFSDVFSKVPIKSEVEILGALSLVMYTIALIPFAKYVFIVLKANDNGEGMICNFGFNTIMILDYHLGDFMDL